jgi:predicted DCC family thiol-disulfide oxidoreductase YuxK
VQETSGNQSTDAADASAAFPRLIYDGDCGFCGYWAQYWQKLTGDRVEYRPYQEVAAQYPTITQADFQRAVQFIAPDGHHAGAAEASFLTLSHARGKGFWLAFYRHLPGFAAVSEWVYAFIAAHRPAFYRISLLLWGRSREPPRFDLVSFLFLRLFGSSTYQPSSLSPCRRRGSLGAVASSPSRNSSMVSPRIMGQSDSS